MRENLFRAAFPALGGLLAIFGIAWLIDPSPSSLPFSVQIASFYKDAVHVGLGTHPAPV